MHNSPLLILVIALPLAGAVFAYVSGRRKAAYAVWSMLITSVAVLAVLTVIAWQALNGQTPVFVWEGFCVSGMALAADGFRALYAWLAALMWGIASVFSFSYFKGKTNVPRFGFFTLLTLSAIIGVFVSDQLTTMVVFFEIMGLSSYPWVAHDETPGAMRAAQSYLWFAVIGGMCIMLGMLLLPKPLLALRFSGGESAQAYGAAQVLLPCCLMLVGFGAKAGAFPLHVWMPKAYPVAPAPASALLSALLSKAGIFGVLILSIKVMREIAAWHTMLFWIGIVTMLAGGLLALVSVNIKRILACSSMSQIGFIFVGIGLYGLLGHHGGVAAQGIVIHMINHTLLKMMLFLCVGIVVMNLGKTDLNDVRGFGRGKPLLHGLFLSGLLGLAGVPLWSGFAGKTLLHEGLTEYIHTLHGGAWLYTGAEWVFILSGGLTLAYMLKLYVCLFWERPAHMQARRAPYMAWSAAVTLCGIAASVWAFGMLPSVFFGGVGSLCAEFLRVEAQSVEYFTADTLLGAAKSIGAGLLVYVLVVRGLLSKKTEGGRSYRNPVPACLNLEDAVYRPVIRLITAVICRFSWAVSMLPDAVVAGLRRALLHVRIWYVPMPGGNRFTCAIGDLMNSVVLFLNKTILRKHPTTVDFSCVFAASNQELGRSVKRLKRSLSYSLLLFCIGLFAVLTYLIFQ